MDIAMLPIGGYAPRWFMQTMHTDPEEAVQTACDAEARVTVPMHWGDLWNVAVGENRPL
jgi:N-acyl-phosphatidylethanolamine-hydrolysing phospholipase D